MPVTPWFMCARTPNSEPQMACRNKYPECANCINREYDPFQCDDCEDASNFESDSDDDDAFDNSEELSFDEFKSLIG